MVIVSRPGRHRGMSFWKIATIRMGWLWHVAWSWVHVCHDNSQGEVQQTLPSNLDHPKCNLKAAEESIGICNGSVNSATARKMNFINVMVELTGHGRYKQFLATRSLLSTPHHNYKTVIISLTRFYLVSDRGRGIFVGCLNIFNGFGVMRR